MIFHSDSDIQFTTATTIPPLRASRLQIYSGGVLTYLEWKIAYRTRPGLTLPSYSGVIPSSQSHIGLSVGKLKLALNTFIKLYRSSNCYC